jgi:AcrR family transcriptional regulator
MGISDRKKREKAKMRKLILDTANALFSKGGLENISIRKIADKIEYSPATIYLYFKDKDEIINSLRDASINDFLQKLEEYSFIKDHFGRLKNLSNSWVDFAISYPQKYNLLLNQNEKIEEDKIFTYLSEILFKTISDNRIQRMPVKEATTIVISFLHGLSQMFMKGKFSLRSKAEQKEYAENIIGRFLNSLKGGY